MQAAGCEISPAVPVVGNIEAARRLSRSASAAGEESLMN
jgi:hypothetical protein